MADIRHGGALRVAGCGDEVIQNCHEDGCTPLHFIALIGGRHLTNRVIRLAEVVLDDFL